MDRRRQGYDFASRLSDEIVYRTAHSLKSGFRGINGVSILRFRSLVTKTGVRRVDELQFYIQNKSA